MIGENSRDIYAGWLMDGSGGSVQKGVLLRIEKGVISHIESCQKSEIPPLTKDFSDCTLLPPFVDCHVHMAMSGSVDMNLRQMQLHADYSQLRPFLDQHSKDLLSHGVLVVRDGGDRNGFVQKFLTENPDLLDGAVEIHTPGRAFHRKGRYGRLIGRTLLDSEDLTLTWTRESPVGDHIKIVQSGLNSLKNYGVETKEQFSLDELRKIVIAANEKGKKVMVHANGREPVRLALEAGCHSIEHGFFMGRDNLQRMTDQGTFWVPTLFTMKAYSQTLKNAQKGDKEIAKRNLVHQLEQVHLARELGVRVALGTDSGSMGVVHGQSVAEELRLFMEAGFSLSEAIQSATSNGARLLGIEKRGLLKPGMEASFLVTRGTPSQLLQNLSSLEAIFINGQPFEGVSEIL